MYQLTDWHLSADQGKCRVHGKVLGHPKWPDGSFIHTSRVKLVTVDEENGCLLADTRSGSHYRLLFADINFFEMEHTQVSLCQMGIPIDFLGRCEAFHAESEMKRLDEADGILARNELFLDMLPVLPQRAYFKDGAGILHRITISEHLGMTQDSVLVTDWENGLVDFRYFPNLAIEPYHWSDGLKAVKIKNNSCKDVIFLGKRSKIVCKPGVVTVIENEYFCSDSQEIG